MGFTIGGMREIRELRLTTRRPRRSDRVSVATAVAEYTGLWGWDVVPGVGASRRGGAQGRIECRCAIGDCRAPGDHPLDPGRVVPAGTTLDQVLRAWEDAWDATPGGATVLLPTGLTFDVVDVPAAAGHLALPRLERMGLPVGPVALAPHDRAWFFVAAGAAAELPQLLYRTGWEDVPLDLRCLGKGAHVTAPPSGHAGQGPVRWLRAPALETATPPQARLLLGTIAYLVAASAR
ncbi:bifunctional DNA primase/polymerase [Streptomyces hainanensis]|uniref:DNA primase n=1 Tax=Streptomyces hainanensis TaxID=402648 RepID=A0A4R4TA27_9ACTN|nr:bifunctional DNA primase/polymerase [Streptomyces hainanensis]TDC73990.1 DNA primase [Streptomyces hainanensis]